MPRTFSWSLFSAALIIAGLIFWRILSGLAFPPAATAPAGEAPVPLSSTLSTAPSVPLASSPPAPAEERAAASAQAASSSPVLPAAPAVSPVPLPDPGVLRLKPESAAPEYKLFSLFRGSGDWFPDLAQAATLVVRRSGSWSDLMRGVSLGENDIVLIPPGVSVLYDASDSPPFAGIALEGTLRFAANTSTKLVAGAIMVYENGDLEIAPLPSARAEIVLRGRVDPARDPAQILPGIIAVGGTVNIEGAPEPTPFTAVSGLAGGTIITASSTAGWRPGDRLYLADSETRADPSFWKYYAANPADKLPFPEAWEEATIAAVSGGSVTLAAPLRFAHRTYAADESRNVVIRSDPDQADFSRGHLMFTGGAKVSVENAMVYDLGRTSVAPADDSVFSPAGAPVHLGQNERGRYPLHAHFLREPFVFSGNVVSGHEVDDSSGRRLLGSPKWGIVTHGSSGTISGNVVLGAAGAGIVGEAGIETGTISGNFVVGMGGGTGLNDDSRFGGSQGLDLGHGGFGFWFRGPFLSVTGNAAAGYFPQAAYSFFLHPAFTLDAIPSHPGVPPDLAGKTEADLVSVNPLREFSGNSAEGIFGLAALSVFYGQSSYAIAAPRFADLSGKAPAVFSRFTKSVTVSGGVLSGAGGPAAAVVSPSGRGATVSLPGASVAGFASPL